MSSIFTSSYTGSAMLDAQPGLYTFSNHSTACAIYVFITVARLQVMSITAWHALHVFLWLKYGTARMAGAVWRNDRIEGT